VRKLVEARPADQRGCRGISGIDRKRPLQQHDRFAHTLIGVSVAQGDRPQIEIVGIEAVSRLPAYPLYLGLPQPRFDRAGGARRRLLLKLEDIVEHAVETVGPDMRAGGRVD
jgi:hypothetical protein